MIASAINSIPSRFRSVTKRALACFGPKAQAFACVGEMAELSSLLIRYGLGRKVSEHAVREEICDVLITLEQMATHFFGEANLNLAMDLEVKLQKLQNVISQEAS